MVAKVVSGYCLSRCRNKFHAKKETTSWGKLGSLVRSATFLFLVLISCS